MATTVIERPELQLEERKELGRRGFLASLAGGLSVGFFMPGFTRSAEAAPIPGAQINSWVLVGTDNSVTVSVGCAEMGQGSWSSIPQIVAEDLMVSYDSIKTVQAPANIAYVTAGSSVVRAHFWPLRKASAGAREILVLTAMQALGDQNRSDYSVAGGIVTNTRLNRSFSYGQLASMLMASGVVPPVPSDLLLVPDSQFKVIGQSVPRLDIPAKTDGSAVYGIDIRLPGMLYAIIKHCPSFGGTLASTPSKPSGAIAVVPTKVMTGLNRGAELLDNVNAVAVVGTNTWDTWQMARQLRVSWKIPPSSAALNNAQFLSDANALLTKATPYSASGANPAGTLYTAESAGNVPSALSTASKTLEAVYTLPYVAHGTMEVLNCTVDYVAGVSCAIYAPTQAAGQVLNLAATLTGLPATSITVHQTFLGGGLGRKAEMDFVSQAIQVAMAVKQPVKLMWPREEDFTHDQYRPGAVIHVKAGLNNSGSVVGWQYRHVSASISAQRGRVLPATGDVNATEGSTGLPYAFGTLLTEYVTSPCQIPVGYWRSVGCSLNTFAVESMIDELALASKQDPYLFRRGLLTDSRWIAVLDAAATLGKWNTPVASGHARGIAISAAFNSIVAEVVDISLGGSNSIKVNSVACAFDCYRPLNPNSITAQIQGGIVHGMNAALWGQITFANGASSVKNFNSARVMRLNEMPVISTVIMPAPAAMDQNTPIGGVGEPAVPPIAPAIANAYAKLTGKRIRTLPFFPGATMGGL